MKTPQIGQQWQCNETQSMFTVIAVKPPYVSIQRKDNNKSKALVIEHFINTYTIKP